VLSVPTLPLGSVGLSFGLSFNQVTTRRPCSIQATDNNVDPNDMKLATTILLIIAGIGSAAAFLSLCAYIFLAVRGKSTTLFLATRGSELLSWRQKVFLILAAAGFLVCMYKGAEALLWWIPGNPGPVGEESYFDSYRSVLALFFAITGGLFLAWVINSVAYFRVYFRIYGEKSVELKRILEASRSAGKLERLANLREEYKEKLAALNAEAYGPDETRSQDADLSPAARRATIFEELIACVAEIEADATKSEASRS
jgi:hypothetical protein